MKKTNKMGKASDFIIPPPDINNNKASILQVFDMVQKEIKEKHDSEAPENDAPNNDNSDGRDINSPN